MAKADLLQVKWFDAAQDYGVVWADGTVVESHLPTSCEAYERLAFHRDRVAQLEAWAQGAR